MIRSQIALIAVLLLAVICTVTMVTENEVRKQDDCPCADPNLCKPLNIVREKETFVFNVFRGNWRNYPWDKITTISPVRFHDPELMCYAHSRNVSIVYFANCNGLTPALIDPKAREDWVNQTIMIMKNYSYDGVVIDYEHGIRPTEPNKTAGLVDTITLLSKRIRTWMKHPQVSMSVNWMPNKMNRHVFGYRQLIPHLDFFYIDDYGQGTWACVNCTTASANADYRKIIKGLQLYLNITDGQKLILSLPWNGFDWTCLEYEPRNHSCRTRAKDDEFQYDNAIGSDDEFGYDDVIGYDDEFGYDNEALELNHHRHRQWKNVKMNEIYGQLLPISFTGRLWEEASKSPYFIYKDVNGTYHDVRYDDPQSLTCKYQLISTYNLRGVGMWHPDSLDYKNTTMVKDFWGGLPNF